MHIHAIYKIFFFSCKIVCFLLVNKKRLLYGILILSCNSKDLYNLPHWQYSPSIFKWDVMLYFLCHPELIPSLCEWLQRKMKRIKLHLLENKNQLKFTGIASLIVCASSPDKWIRDSGAMKQLKLMTDGLNMTVTWATSPLGRLETRRLLVICGLRKTPVKSHSAFYQLNYTCCPQGGQSSAWEFIFPKKV